MKTIKSLMKFSETRELGKLRHDKYERINAILNKPFMFVSVKDLCEIAETDIFDSSFVSLLFSELWQRYSENKPITE